METPSLIAAIGAPVVAVAGAVTWYFRTRRNGKDTTPKASPTMVCMEHSKVGAGLDRLEKKQDTIFEVLGEHRELIAQTRETLIGTEAMATQAADLGKQAVKGIDDIKTMMLE